MQTNAIHFPLIREMSLPLKSSHMSKRNRLAAALSATGILRLLETIPSRPQLIVLNYHRIGDADSSHFDPGVFSASAEGFDEQIRVLKSRYRFATVGQAVDIIERRESLSEAMILMTFDDGYRDNFTEAFPILQRHGIEGIFFLVSSDTGTDRVLWWDEIAYLAKRHSPKTLRIKYPHTEDFDLSPENFKEGLRRLLRVFKGPATTDTSHFLAMLKESVGFSSEDVHADLIMSWDDARAMRAGGMTIGLHAHTHRILAKLPLEQQIGELKKCREKIEAEIGVETRILAYPDGARDAFNNQTIEAAREVGVRVAFSFYGGTNLANNINTFDVRRVAYESYAPASRVRLSTAAMAATGRIWI